MNILTLQPELLMTNGLNLNYQQLLFYCVTNSTFRKICNNNYFWTLKAQHDF